VAERSRRLSRETGLVVGKDFRPPQGRQPLDWCYLTVDLADEERISIRIKRDHVNRAAVGDVVVFRRPRDSDHATGVKRVGSSPGLLPPVTRRPND
jgi:hypothetical protein